MEQSIVNAKFAASQPPPINRLQKPKQTSILLTQDPNMTGILVCEVFRKECKGKRGLSLHQKKCIRVHPSIISSASSPNMSTAEHPETENHNLQSTSDVLTLFLLGGGFLPPAGFCSITQK